MSALVTLQGGQFAGGVLVIAAGGGQPDPQEAGPEAVVGDHVLDFGGPGRQLPVALQAFVHASQALCGAVVGRPVEVDLAELGEDLQRQIVAVQPFDLRAQ